MQTVHKYEIPVTNYFEIELPKGSLILRAGKQRYHNVFWALVDTEKPTEIRKFWRVGTGYSMKNFDDVNARFIDTWQDGDLVWHLFEVIRSPYVWEARK
jgi:hypothetical protein